MKPEYKRKKTPTVIQMEAVECGAASLSIILSYYKRYIPLEQLRRECDVNRDGSSAKNILAAAEKHGFETGGYKFELEDFEEQEFPVIIHWNFNHFLVLEGFRGNWAYLNDPAVGHRKVTLEEFGKSFTGIVLELVPDETFSKFGRKSNLINGIRTRMIGYGNDLLYIFLIGVLLAIPGIIIPVFTKFFIDDILIGKADDWLLALIGGMFLTAILRSFLEYLKQNKLLLARNKLDIVSSANYFWHVLRLPINFFNQRYRGEIGSRIAINAKVTDLITNKLANNLLDVLLLLFYFIIMLYYDVQLAIIGACFSLMNIFAIKFISAKRAEGYLNYSVESGNLIGLTMGGIKTIETLKAMGRENDFFVKWAGYFSKVINAGQKLGALTLLLNSIPVLLYSLSTLVILVLGANKVIDGILTIGTLVAFQSLMASFNQPIDNLVQLAGDIQEASGDVNRLDDVVKSEIDSNISKWENNTTPYTNKIGDKLDGYIEFKNVTFGYNLNTPPLIENLNIKLNPGERIALVGGSGSGKSTIINLLTGFFEPWSGEILFDGKPRHQFPREVITNSMSMVSQEFFLFEGTVRNVITVWDKSIDDNMLINAAKDACIHEIISGKNNAYEYILSEGGKNLSGGQRQRFEIARALAVQPTVLILDEATSALDPITEKSVMDNIRARKCSVVIVAHRLSTIRDSDEIIVLKTGKIIERGIHKDLIKLNGEYARLLEN